MWCKNKMMHVMQEIFFFLVHGLSLQSSSLIKSWVQNRVSTPNWPANPIDSTQTRLDSPVLSCLYVGIYHTFMPSSALPQVCHICNEPSRHDALPNLDHFQGVFIYYIPQLMMRSYTPWTQFSFLLFIFWNELHLTNWSHFLFLYKIEILL